VIHAALAKVEGVGKGAVKIIARLTYRQRYEQSTGRDPFRCPHCGAEMAVWRIWHPKYGVIYDEGEVIKRGTYTSTAQRAGPCRQADIPQVRPEGVMCFKRCGQAVKCSGLQSKLVRTAISALSGPHSLHLSPCSGPHYLQLRLQSSSRDCNPSPQDRIICT